MFSTVLLHWYLYRDGPSAPKKDFNSHRCKGKRVRVLEID